MFVDLGIGVWPRCYTPCKAADVDKVKVIGWICPREICVIDFIGQVGWRAGVENGREICRRDFGVGKVVGYVNSPKAGAGSDVENASWICERSEEEFVVQG